MDTETDDDTNDIHIVLAGKWQKASPDPNATPYPDEIEFRSEGIYFASKGETGQDFSIWDSGSYHLSAPNEARISTATDAEISYPFSLENDELTFRDPQNGHIKYRRVEK